MKLGGMPIYLIYFGMIGYVLYLVIIALKMYTIKHSLAGKGRLGNDKKIVIV